MADAVAAGDGLDAVAALTAEATGGTVAIVLPAVGAAVAGAGGERRLGAVRRFVAARLAGQPGALPEGPRWPTTPPTAPISSAPFAPTWRTART